MPGTYEGASSQGYPLKFKVVTHVTNSKCGQPTTAICLELSKCFQSTTATCLELLEPWPVMTELCTNRGTPTLELDASVIPETGSGTFDWTEKQEQGPLHWVQELGVHVSGANARGTMHTTEQFVTGEPISCDSGVVTFTAHLI